MPRAPLRTCSVPGCPTLIARGSKCQQHERERHRSIDERRRREDPAGRAFYASPAWRRLRAIVLQQEPTCQLCSLAPSDTVDHIVDRRKRPDLALVRDNLRGVCKRCHDQRTARDHLRPLG